MDIDWSESTTYVNEILKHLKENNNMFDISNIKIGDYVKTRDNYVGYVTDLSDNLFLFRYYTEENGLIGVCAGSNLSSVFKQIGTYKFNEEKDEKKIGAILNIKYDYDQQDDREIRKNLRCDMWNCVNKINEIIDSHNELLDRLNDMEDN